MNFSRIWRALFRTPNLDDYIAQHLENSITNSLQMDWLSSEIQYELTKGNSVSVKLNNKWLVIKKKNGVISITSSKLNHVK